MTRKKQTWIICYDIANPRRLQRVHRILRQQAIAVQYSLFVAPLTPSELDLILKAVEAEINPREDDVRAYPIRPDSTIIWGPAWISGDIYITPFPLPGLFAANPGNRDEDLIPDADLSQ